MKRTTCIVSVVMALAAAPAAAQEAGWYIGGSLGQSMVDISESDLTTDLNSIGITTSGMTTDEKDVGWKAILGYRAHRNFAVEGSYVNLGEFTARTTVSAINGIAITPQQLTVSVKAKDVFSIAAVGILPIGNNLSAFAKLGAYSADAELHIAAAGSLTESERDEGLLFGAGLNFDLTRNISIRGEWERFADVGTDRTGGEGDVDLVSIGAVYRF